MPKELSITPFDSTLGVDILESKPQYAKISLPFQKRLANPYGSLHGGVISTLVDSTMAVAVLSTYPDSLFYTRRLNIKFVSQAKKGAVFAEALTIFVLNNKQG